MPKGSFFGGMSPTMVTTNNPMLSTPDPAPQGLLDWARIGGLLGGPQPTPYGPPPVMQRPPNPLPWPPRRMTFGGR